MEIKDYVVGDENLDNTVLVFGAIWCGPCKMYKAGALAEVASTTDIQIIYVDVDSNPDVVALAGVSSVPTTLITLNGRAIPLNGPQTAETITAYFA